MSQHDTIKLYLATQDCEIYKTNNGVRSLVKRIDKDEITGCATLSTTHRWTHMTFSQHYHINEVKRIDSVDYEVMGNFQTSTKARLIDWKAYVKETHGTKAKTKIGNVRDGNTGNNVGVWIGIYNTECIFIELMLANGIILQSNSIELVHKRYENGEIVQKYTNDEHLYERVEEYNCKIDSRMETILVSLYDRKRPSKKKLNDVERSEIITLLHAGYTHRAIAQAFNVSHGSIATISKQQHVKQRKPTS